MAFLQLSTYKIYKKAKVLKVASSSCGFAEEENDKSLFETTPTSQ